MRSTWHDDDDKAGAVNDLTMYEIKKENNNQLQLAWTKKSLRHNLFVGASESNRQISPSFLYLFWIILPR